tara:strand:- start:7680 stop:7874 length:195 start_codon:yes stop_codon:yes gene_type:complete
MIARGRRRVKEKWGNFPSSRPLILWRWGKIPQTPTLSTKKVKSKKDLSIGQVFFKASTHNYLFR